MRRCALINTWCNTPEKLNILSINIDKLKSKNFDIILISPIGISMPVEISEKCDFIIYCRENPINTNKFVYHWVVINSKKLINTIYDYGFASLIKYKRLIDFATNLEYDEYYLMIYDTNIDERFDEILQFSHSCSFFEGKKGPVCGNLLIFDKENAKKFSSLSTWESYFNPSFEFAEQWLFSIAGEMNAKIHQISIDDLISTEISIIKDYDDFSYFIQKDNPISLYFFNVKNSPTIKLRSSGKERLITLSDDMIVGLEDFLDSKIELIFDNNVIDLSFEIKNILSSTIQFL